jgi:hypothetical protein
MGIEEELGDSDDDNDATHMGHSEDDPSESINYK